MKKTVFQHVHSDLYTRKHSMNTPYCPIKWRFKKLRNVFHVYTVSHQLATEEVYTELATPTLNPPLAWSCISLRTMQHCLSSELNTFFMPFIQYTHFEDHAFLWFLITCNTSQIVAFSSVCYFQLYMVFIESFFLPF